MQQGLTIDELKKAVGDLMIEFKIRENQYVQTIQQLQQQLESLQNAKSAEKPKN